MVSNRPYMSVLRDLERRKISILADLQRLQVEFSELESLIAGISKLLPSSMGEVTEGSGELSGMSTRWAILTVLGKQDVSAAAVSDIVDLLLAGSFPQSDKLRTNVAAVLSRMVASEELQNTGNSYEMTDKGRGALRVIQLRPKRTGVKSSETVDDVEVADGA